MKKLIVTCVVMLAFCAIGQVADAHPYGYGCDHGRRVYVVEGGCPVPRFAYFDPYGCYVYRGPRRVYIQEYYYSLPPRECYTVRRPYYEGRVVPEERYTEPRVYDYGK